MDYSDYWEGSWEERERRGYYHRLYRDIKGRIVIPPGQKILDIGGGDGHLMHYLGISGADVLDISDSGLRVAEQHGYRPIQGDLQKAFPLEPCSYGVAFCFEVLEHLHHPEVTIAEARRILKPDGILYVGQPNMRADGVHHVRRFYKKDIEELLENSGFKIDWIDYVPGFIVRDAIIDDIHRSPWPRKIKQSIALLISLLPRTMLRLLARMIPDRFCLIFVVRAIKK